MNRVILACILACLIAAIIACVLMLLLTFDSETVAAALLISLFSYPSIILFIISRTSPRWSRYAASLYVVPAVVGGLLFILPAVTASEGHAADLAALCGTVLAGTLMVMFPISGMIVTRIWRAVANKS